MDKNRHIYILDEESRASVYGIGTYINLLIEIFKYANVSLHIIKLSSNVEEVCREEYIGYDVYKIPYMDLRNGVVSEIYYKRAWYLIRLYVDSLQGNSVFVLNHLIHYMFVERIRNAFANAKIYFVVHYENWCFELDGDYSKFVGIISKRRETMSSEENFIYELYEYEKKVYEDVDKIISLSEFTYRLIVEHYGIDSGKVRVINNALNDESFVLSCDERESLKKRLGIGSKEKILLYVGRLDHIKGLHYLLQSIPLLLRKISDFKLLVVGDGSIDYYIGMCKEFRGKILFMGHLKKDELYKLYSISDIGILPSMHEQCSFVAIEMMMFGLPMIISTTTGLNEMMDNEDFGYHVAIENKNQGVIDDLANKIYSLLMCSTHRFSKLKLHSKMCFEKKYALCNIWRDYYEFFDMV